MRFCIYSDVTSETLALYRELLEASAPDEAVEIEICSAGGDVFAALAIIDLNAMQRRSTSAVVLGWAASAAALIALSCDHVCMTGNGSMLLHSVWADGGIDKETRDYINARQLAVINRRDPSYTLADLDNDVWYDAKECAARHFADDVINDAVAQAAARFAAHIATSHKYKGVAMSETKKPAIKAECGGEDERKVNAAEGEQGVEEAVESGDRSLVDVVEKIGERLDEIEHRLAVLEGEGKRADDEDAGEAGDVIAARINRVYAKLNRMSAKDTPCAPETFKGRKEEKMQASLERSKKLNLMANFVKE